MRTSWMVWVVIVVGACASNPPARSGGGLLDTCMNVNDRAHAFLAAHDACTTDADCVIASAGCIPDVAEGCCVTYLDRSGEAEWKQLVDEAKTCAGAEAACACCASIPAEAGCIEGTCKPRRVTGG